MERMPAPPIRIERAIAISTKLNSNPCPLPGVPAKLMKKPWRACTLAMATSMTTMMPSAAGRARKPTSGHCAASHGSVFWAVEMTGPARRTLRRRVYTIAVALLPALAAPLAAQVDLSVDPAMTRGPAQAPVVIVEFSDYQ
ncbi:MAG: hypothetical protein ACREM3_17495 [Candidatus Rokuibacteriota bacterium]